VTVLDAGAPTITCPANISQNITTGCNTSLTVLLQLFQMNVRQDIRCILTVHLIW